MRSQEINISQYLSHFRQSGPVILLESQMVDHPASETTYLAANPKAWIKCFGNKVEVMNGGHISNFHENPWKALYDFRKQHTDWMFGYLGYDLKNFTEHLKSENPDTISAPDLFFFVPETIISWDKINQPKVIKGEIPDRFESDINHDREKCAIRLNRQIAKEGYIDKVNKAKQDIYEGSYYEINLSHPLQFDFQGNTVELYHAMKAIGPVPFAAYAELDDFTICCSSPERFLAKKGGRVWSQPIKGTSSRNSNLDDDILAEQLRNSEKEQAENLMIVDLVRNDLGRIAIHNSVQVSELFEIQTFETVHQMVSTVECEVDNETDCIEIIRSCFPMGSMTGAPKISAMKAIEKYENYKRGVYSGAIGYIKPNGDFDLNVVIRTALIQNDTIVYPVGGAITSDSDAEAEWKETLIKARALTNILNDFKNPE